VALIAVVVLVGLLIPTRPLGIDQNWSELMHDSEAAFFHQLALVFNYLGRGLGRALSLAAIGVALLVARRWRALLAFASTEALTPLTTNVFKHLVDRPRPPNPMLHANGSSFPSGHSSYAAATAVALVLLFSRPGKGRLIWWALAALSSAAMAWSRTYLQLHWLTDVLAGALLGTGIALLCFASAQIVRASQGTPQRPSRKPPGVSVDI
jgi:undecaprenyl-diphosphatase